ncbi:agglutinin biogenesis protein MshK [Pseudoalteromonas shioyasakiensis]|uniref:agglutinin biogenesis protein MshK n=1 Tax=Pseudoalteromonas shioyasakiensis TaxID=1190813 RepID=UPI002117FFEC|nr:agglutinin biogenesis protein MshK [Pseudoalteromonas shioyasakiensis]MCQ8879163.1 agglutinin biogenesis protein MshK [Pseudoalteromonas shioyasakiensis]
MKNLLLFSLVGLLLGSAQAIAEQLVDPTKPQNVIVGNQAHYQKSELKLQSIIKRSGSYKAIISGQLYGIGEQLNGYKVLTISSKNVVLANDNKQIKLDLYDYEIKN